MIQSNITSINLNDTIKLTELECRYNYLTSIDLTNCDELTTVYLYFNSLTSLNLSNLKKLTTAGCTYNNLTSLTLGDLPALEELYCSYNDLTVLSLSGLPDLYYLNCNNNNLTSLDLSRSPQLKYLYCKYNNLNNLNVSALFGLEEVECSYNNLTTLSFEMAPKKLVCNNNNLVSLKLNDQSKLKHLLCENNSLQLLDLRETFELNSSEVFGDFDGVSVINNDFCDENDILGVELWGEAHPRIAFSPQSVWENNPFNDIFIETNGYKAVEYMVEHSYMLGTSSTSFSPNDTVSRRQMVVVMYVMAGAPDVSNLSIPFTDVASNDYSHNAVKWAYNNGIVGGTSATTFSPHDPVNRKSAAVMMNKFAQYNNWTLPVIREYMDFADESSISSWAKESVQLVYNAGIMNYSSSSANNYYFAPNQNLTRGELAVILRKFEVMKLYL